MYETPESLGFRITMIKSKIVKNNKLVKENINNEDYVSTLLGLTKESMRLSGYLVRECEDNDGEYSRLYDESFMIKKEVLRIHYE